MNKDELIRDISNVGMWYQKFHFPYDITVGSWDTESKMLELCRDIDLNGKTFLDVGCLEGAASLWMEEEGASGICFDAWPAVVEKIRLVKKYLGLKAEYHTLSIYDLGPLTSVDIVVMMGVYYHLKHPIYGIEQSWRACKEYLLIEGEVASGTGSLAYFYKDEYQGDVTNYWVPTVQCLYDWCSTLDGIESMRLIYPFLTTSRAGVVIKKSN